MIYVVDIMVMGEPRPRLNGPFTTRAEAESWIASLGERVLGSAILAVREPMRLVAVP